MIDWVRVVDLRNEIGVEGFAEVIELFLEEVEGVIATLGQTPGALPEELHFLKGSSLNLGFAALGERCSSAERCCAEGKAALVDIAALRACYEASKTEFLNRMQDSCSAA